MVKLGYKLMSEEHAPEDLVANARRAEDEGFDFVAISDHFHPWLESQGHSPFAWNVLSAIAATTDRIELATAVTCPFLRYHPAIVAQSAATLARLSDGRFTLGLGAGERLNEHVVGRGWPPVSIRHEMLVEAVDIIRALFSGGMQRYRGEHLTLEDARLYDLPDEPVPLAIAASGPASVSLAAEKGDGLFATDPDDSLTAGYAERGGTGPRYAEVPLCWAADEEEAARTARDRFAFGIPGWKVQAELPNPVNFEAAVSTVRLDDVRESMAIGPDPERHLEVIGEFRDAGFDHLVLVGIGPDQAGFLDFYRDELAPRLADWR